MVWAGPHRAMELEACQTKEMVKERDLEGEVTYGPLNFGGSK